MFLAVQSVHPPGTRGVVGYFGGFGTEAHKSGGLLRYRGAQGIGANKAHRGVGGGLTRRTPSLICVNPANHSHRIVCITCRFLHPGSLFDVADTSKRLLLLA